VDFESDEAVIDRLDPPLKVLYALALNAGLRRGEAVGLRWRNVALDVGVVATVGQLRARPFEVPEASAEKADSEASSFGVTRYRRRNFATNR